MPVPFLEIVESTIRKRPVAFPPAAAHAVLVATDRAPLDPDHGVGVPAGSGIESIDPEELQSLPPPVGVIKGHAPQPIAVACDLKAPHQGASAFADTYTHIRVLPCTPAAVLPTRIPGLIAGYLAYGRQSDTKATACFARTPAACLEIHLCTIGRALQEGSTWNNGPN